VSRLWSYVVFRVFSVAVSCYGKWVLRFAVAVEREYGG
jgi:hypothetical protein